MEASKVSFFQHTKEQLNSRPLDRKAKVKLRRQRIIEFIRELPYGECQKADLIAAAGWDISVQQQYSNGWSFIERLRKNKVIRMSDGSNPKNTYIKKWEVVADIRVTKPAVEARQGYPEGTFPQIPPEVEQENRTRGLHEELVEVAKEFAWQMNSDSLRDFIAWVKR